MAVPESLLSVTTLPSSDWQVEATQAFREAGMFTQSLEEGEWHLDLQTQKEAHSWPSKQCEVKPIVSAGANNSPAALAEGQVQKE